jgi:tripartite-type tricarboxylate transporter receptor subunit TctC
MRTVLKRCLALGALGAFAASGFAQTYPTKPINIIVPTPPAGPLDWMARTFGAKLQERWGQPAVIENKPGAGGWLGAQAV